MSKLQFLPVLFFSFPCCSKFRLEHSEKLLQFSLNPQGYLPDSGSIALSIVRWQVGQAVCIGVWKEQIEKLAEWSFQLPSQSFDRLTARFLGFMESLHQFCLDVVGM